MQHATFDSDPSEVADGIWVVQIPLDVRTEPANAYMLRDADGTITIFDTGVAQGARERWSRSLHLIGARPSDVQRIVISHHHPDHIGGAGALHALTGAPVYGSRSTMAQAPDVWGTGGRLDAYFGEIRAYLRAHGLPEATARALDHEVEVARAWVELPPDAAWQALEDSDVVEVGQRAWRVRLVPGHADGHIVLHDTEHGLLLAGDHLLERISPAVGRFPRHEPDPLGRYMESLMVVAMLDPAEVLPGHGKPFAGGCARARALMTHHVERVDACVDAVRAGDGSTAWEVATRVFAHVFDADEPAPANLRFATTETIAHLERARREGRVTSEQTGGIVRYRSS